MTKQTQKYLLYTVGAIGLIGVTYVVIKAIKGDPKKLAVQRTIEKTSGFSNFVGITQEKRIQNIGTIAEIKAKLSGVIPYSGDKNILKQQLQQLESEQAS